MRFDIAIYCNFFNTDNQEKLKGYSTFLEIGSFYSSLRVKQLSFTIFESIQPIF